MDDLIARTVRDPILKAIEDIERNYGVKLTYAELDAFIEKTQRDDAARELDHRFKTRSPDYKKQMRWVLAELQNPAPVELVDEFNAVDAAAEVKRRGRPAKTK